MGFEIGFVLKVMYLQVAPDKKPCHDSKHSLQSLPHAWAMGGSLLDEKTTWEEFGKGLRLGTPELRKKSASLVFHGFSTNHMHLEIFHFPFYLNVYGQDWRSFIAISLERLPDSS